MTAELSAPQAISAIMSDLDAIPKGNKGHGYQYRGIDDVMKALNPLLVKHGVVIAPRATSAEVHPAAGRKEGWTAARVSYEFDIYGPDGTHITTAAFAEGLSNQGTGPGIAASYAYKSMVLQLFCIPTEDLVDAEQIEPAVPAPKVTVQQAKQIGDAFAVISDDTVRKRIKHDWVSVWGPPRQLDASDFDAAYADALERVEADMSWNEPAVGSDGQPIDVHPGQTEVAQ